MAQIRVGVKRISEGFEVDEPGEVGFEVTQQWVEIDGLRLTAKGTALMDVSYAPDEPGGSGIVTVRFLCEGFATVDHRT